MRAFRLPFFFIAAAPLAMLGCRAEVTTTTPAAENEVLVEREPPAEQVEEQGTPPSAEHFWIRGHWHWNGHEYVWIRGHWEIRRAGWEWIPGHWEHHHKHYRWIEGHWRRV